MTRRAVAFWALIFLLPTTRAVAQMAPGSPCPQPLASPYAQSSQVQPQPCSESIPRGRELAGHLFIPSSLVLDPFTATLASRNFGAGYARIRGPKFDMLANITGSEKYTARGVVSSGIFQWGVNDWFAVRLSSSFLILTGSHSDGAIAIGETAQYSLGGGATLSHRFGAHARLALTFDAAYAPVSDLNLLPFISETLRAGAISRDGLVLTTHNVSIVPGVSAAYALSPALGVVANIQYLHAFPEIAALRADTDGMELGWLVDLDLKQLNFLPIGLNAAYRIVIPLGHNDASVEHDFTPGLFFTGNPRVVVGSEVAFSWFRPSEGRRGYAFLPQIVLRYYW